MLEEAQVPVAWEDSLAGDQAAPERHSPRWEGRLQVRSGLDGDGADPLALGLDADRPGFRLKVRRRIGQDPQDPGGWACDLDQGPVRVLGGSLGLAHGQGLLAGAPGRSGTLSAEQGLLPGSLDWRLWPYAADRGSVRGAGIELRAGRWRLQSLAGQDPGAGPWLVRLSRQGGEAEFRIGLMHVLTQNRQGLGLTVGRRTGALDFDLEAAMSRDRGAGAPAEGSVATVGWTVSGAARIEWSAGWHRGGPPTPLAVRPAILTGWDGRGWALRCKLRPAVKLTLRLLAAGSVASPPGEGCAGSGRVLRELVCEHRPSPGWRVAGRWRRQADRAWEPPERYPWLPPDDLPDRLRTLVSVRVVREVPGLRAQCEWRSLELGRKGLVDTRSLVAVTLVGDLTSAWRLRGHRIEAWGDPVDLVSAVTPFTGLVMPRHWGGWEGEAGLGLEYRREGFAVQAGAARRIADGTGDSLLEVRARGTWRF